MISRLFSDLKLFEWQNSCNKPRNGLCELEKRNQLSSKQIYFSVFFSYGERTFNAGAVFNREVFPMGEKKFCCCAISPMGREILYWGRFSYGKFCARVISSEGNFYTWSFFPGGKCNPGLFSPVFFAEVSFVFRVLPSI